ncbi:hypothetical protein [Christiangramia sabulilitoris]|uniref:DUF1735 domain-containing protein n=1 Tax=Christiangramia sabulilitoris TaxID=2583991 RepID=A0A550I4E6_9FLAO|nr:hypothetical protein [Christiangramia sabulilitoris]TRO65698.1 hypothetical protein FGM01_09890 [Christiangramia sabulilitoris]
MKKFIINAALLLAVGIGFTSCDYDETNFADLTNEYTGNSTFYLQFSDAAQNFETSFDANGQPVDITTSVAIKLIGPPRTEDLAVNLSLDAASDFTSDMYEIGSTSLVIPAGETSASTTLTFFVNTLPVDETSAFILNIDAGENTATAGDVLTYNVFRTPPCIPIPGVYTIEMTDSYGDGWQTVGDGGPGITIEVDGVIIDEVGLCSPYEAQSHDCIAEDSAGVDTVEIPEGSLFAKWVFPGDTYGEIGYKIFDPNGVLVASANAGDATAGTIDVQACVEEVE